MNFKDQGIIISKKALKEHNYIITVFTKNHGIYSGVLKHYSNKTYNNLVEGNLIDFFWSARLHEHIGSVRAELVKSYNAHLLMNKTKLYAFNSIASLLKLSFGERQPHNKLFPVFLSFLESMKNEFSFKNYIKLELTILSEAGYPLQLDKCAATYSPWNLYYVSPRSGCAISKEAGEPYADKLLKLPTFLLEELSDNSEICNNKNETITKDVEPIKASKNTLEQKNSYVSSKIDNCIDYHTASDAFNLISYFLNRYILVNKEQPQSRYDFIEHILDNLKHIANIYP